MADIKNAGGEIYAICGQSQQAVDETQKDWQLSYQLIADPSHALVKKYNMGTLNSKGGKFNKLVSLLEKLYQQPKGNFPQPEEEEIAMPGVLVFKQDGTVLYKWTAQAKQNNLMGGLNRVNPADVLKIVKFYFANASIVDSVKDHVKHNMYDTFQAVLADPDGRIMFRNHLRKEFNEEALEFLGDVEQYKTKVGSGDSIYVSYIPGGSPKELNLPGSVRRKVDEQYHKGDKDAFDDAYSHVKVSLGEDSFARFTNTEDFIRLATKIVPTCFTSEAYDDFCMIKK